MNPQAIVLSASIFGGLAVFIFGMHLMSDGLQKTVGDRMRGILSMLTSHPIKGIIAGIVAAVIFQSSSATILMTLSFANAGLIGLRQAISVIIGANLGATVTSQITAFDLGSYAWIFVFIGFVLLFFMKSKEWAKDAGQIIFGFGIFFVGIATMDAAFIQLADTKSFTDIVSWMSGMPVAAVLFGLLVALLLNSSAAVIALIQCVTVMSLEGVIPVILGANVGVAIRTFLSAGRTSVNGKRAATAHVVFNITAFVIAIWFIPQIAYIVEAISPQGLQGDVIARQAANVNLIFNLFGAVIFLPLSGVLSKILKKCFKDNVTDSKLHNDGYSGYLDVNIINQPEVAMHMVIRELLRIGRLARDMFIKCKRAFISADIKTAEQVIDEDRTINILRDRLVRYLSEILASENTNDYQKNAIAEFYHMAADVEHIGDYCKNIATLAIEKERNEYKLSDKAYTEIYECFDLVKKMMDDTFDAIDEGSSKIADSVIHQEDKIDIVEADFRSRHISRLESGECDTASTVVYVDVMHNLERIGDSCSNIAEAINRGFIFKRENEGQ